MWLSVASIVAGSCMARLFENRCGVVAGHILRDRRSFRSPFAGLLGGRASGESGSDLIPRLKHVWQAAGTEQAKEQPAAEVRTFKVSRAQNCRLRVSPSDPPRSGFTPLKSCKPFIAG